MTRHYSLDSIVVRGRRIFGWGFCLDRQRPIRVRSLRMPLEDGGSFDLDVYASGSRPDLSEAFADVPHAAGSGFMVTGRLPAPVGRGTAELILVGGERLPLPRFPEAYVPATDLSVHRGWARVKAIARQRGWMGALVATIGGVRRRIALAAQPGAASTLRAARGATVVFDHGMGGGANRYRTGRVGALTATGATVVLVTSDLSSLSYRLRVIDGATDSHAERRIENQAELLRVVESIAPAAIEVNNLVGYEDVPAMLAAFVKLRRLRPELRFRFNLHDFLALCPSFTLIDASGRHCAVPAHEVCRTCLPANVRFSLGMSVGIGIAEWRQAWSEWLALVDERVAFSKSSLAMFSKGIPDIASLAWRLEPHAVDASDLRLVAPRLDRPVAVVAVGHLNHAKGGELLGALARRAEERRLPLRFAVVGTVEGGAIPPSVRVTGAFRREQLCELLEAEGTGIALLPSICPETYSYVTDELMATGLPLAVLDLGAPAERVAGYHSGLLLPTQGLDAQLDALLAFARRLGAFS